MRGVVSPPLQPSHPCFSSVHPEAASMAATAAAGEAPEARQASSPITAAMAATSVPPHALLHEYVQRQVKATPHAIAIQDATTTLTYSQLWERGCELASKLQEVGVSHGSLVGVLLSRSHATIVAILGVLISGGAYVVPCCGGSPCGGACSHLPAV